MQPGNLYSYILQLRTTRRVTGSMRFNGDHRIMERSILVKSSVHWNL